MDNFLNTQNGFETALKLIETINRSTDDYLFIWDIKADTRWFFGDIDKYYDIRKDGSTTNSTPEMLKIIHPSDSEAVLKSLNQIANGEKDVHNMDYRWINRKGEKVWINCHGTLIRDNENIPNIMIGRVSEEKLRHLYNPLTGLWNKNKLLKDLECYLYQSAKYLMLIDIDNLSTINLTHGRSYGDLLLKEIAEVCENSEKASAAYHIDHNYFALVLDTVLETDVRAAYEQIKKSMLEKCTFTASAVPIDKNLFFDGAQLMDSINMTLKKAKNISNNRIEFFSKEDLNKKIAFQELFEELKQSVENGFKGFEVYYQPQIRARSYEIHGVEALLRYVSPSRGKVFPEEIIPILEESRLIKNVDMWVLRKALTQCKKWRKKLPELCISVNFSVTQFEDPYFSEKIIEEVNKSGLPGNALTIEITESVGLHNNTKIIDILKRLKNYNINFAIDDFGTGYSNLGYLKQLDVDEIKIDRIFVSDIEKETYNYKLISNVIEFAKANDIRTCCEGVENARELITLELLSPDIIQGYLFSKPCTVEQIEKTYVNPNTNEYKERIRFMDRLFNIKEKMGVVPFDPKDILRENAIGLWIMRLDSDKAHYELHVDQTMEQLLATDKKRTPRECFEYWAANIHNDYYTTVKNCLREMILSDQIVQIEFLWHHPEGDVKVRFSGKRAKDTDGMIVLQGYCRNISICKEHKGEKNEVYSN